MESPASNYEVRLPADIKDLYQLAKESSTYYEELTGTWNENALARFRDALDHIVSASQSDHAQSVSMHLDSAKEHLAEIITEPIQDAVVNELSRSERRLTWYAAKRLALSLPPQDEVRSRQSFIRYELQQGHSSKGSLETARVKEGFDHFVRAYNAARELNILMQDAHVRWRFFVKALLWLLPIVIGIAVAFWQ